MATNKPKTTPWNEIEADYIRGEYKNQDLADKYSISINTLENRIKIKEWKRKKTELNGKIQKEVAKKIIKAEVSRTEKQLALADSIRELMQKGINQLLVNPEFKIADIKTLTSSLTDLQKVERTAEGLDDKNINDEAPPTQIIHSDNLDDEKI